jgi:hypothetical protein
LQALENILHRINELLGLLNSKNWTEAARKGAGIVSDVTSEVSGVGPGERAAKALAGSDVAKAAQRVLDDAMAHGPLQAAANVGTSFAKDMIAPPAAPATPLPATPPPAATPASPAVPSWLPQVTLPTPQPGASPAAAAPVDFGAVFGAFDNVPQAARAAADTAGGEFNAVLGTHLNRSVGMIQQFTDWAQKALGFRASPTIAPSFATAPGSQGPGSRASTLTRGAFSDAGPVPTH